MTTATTNYNRANTSGSMQMLILQNSLDIVEMTQDQEQQQANSERMRTSSSKLPQRQPSFEDERLVKEEEEEKTAASEQQQDGKDLVQEKQLDGAEEIPQTENKAAKLRRSSSKWLVRANSVLLKKGEAVIAVDQEDGDDDDSSVSSLGSKDSYADSDSSEDELEKSEISVEMELLDESHTEQGEDEGPEEGRPKNIQRQKSRDSNLRRRRPRSGRFSGSSGDRSASPFRNRRFPSLDGTPKQLQNKQQPLSPLMRPERQPTLESSTSKSLNRAKSSPELQHQQQQSSRPRADKHRRNHQLLTQLDTGSLTGSVKSLNCLVSEEQRWGDSNACMNHNPDSDDDDDDADEDTHDVWRKDCSNMPTDASNDSRWSASTGRTGSNTLNTEQLDQLSTKPRFPRRKLTGDVPSKPQRQSTGENLPVQRTTGGVPKKPKRQTSGENLPGRQSPSPARITRGNSRSSLDSGHPTRRRPRLPNRQNTFGSSLSLHEATQAVRAHQQKQQHLSDSSGESGASADNAASNIHIVMAQTPSCMPRRTISNENHADEDDDDDNKHDNRFRRANSEPCDLEQPQQRTPRTPNRSMLQRQPSIGRLRQQHTVPQIRSNSRRNLFQASINSNSPHARSRNVLKASSTHHTSDTRSAARHNLVFEASGSSSAHGTADTRRAQSPRTNNVLWDNNSNHSTNSAPYKLMQMGASRAPPNRRGSNNADTTAADDENGNKRSSLNSSSHSVGDRSVISRLAGMDLSGDGTGGSVVGQSRSFDSVGNASQSSFAAESFAADSFYDDDEEDDEDFGFGTDHNNVDHDENGDIALKKTPIVVLDVLDNTNTKVDNNHTKNDKSLRSPMLPRRQRSFDDVDDGADEKNSSSSPMPPSPRHKAAALRQPRVVPGFLEESDDDISFQQEKEGSLRMPERQASTGSDEFSPA